MNQPRTWASSRRLGAALFVFLVTCLLFGAYQGAADVQADQNDTPPVAVTWTADELGLARPSAEEVRAAVLQLPAGEPRAAEPAPRATYTDPTSDLLYKWLYPSLADYGLSPSSGGVVQADVPTQGLGLPATFRWQVATLDAQSSNVAAFDRVPDNTLATFNGTSAALSDATSTSIPAFADLTHVSIAANGPTTRWRVTTRGAHPPAPEYYRSEYNLHFESGSREFTQWMGGTPFTGSGWRWAIFDRGTYFPGWNDDLDIISVGVDPAPNDGIRFSARVDGSLMSTYTANAAWPRFEWYIDADNDAGTGDNFSFGYRHGSYSFSYFLVGIDAIASAHYDPDAGRWVGMLRKKVSPTQWQTLDVGVPTLTTDGVTIDFPRSTAGLRSTFRWGLLTSFNIRRGGMDYFGRVDVAPNSGMKAETLPVSADQILAERFAPILMLGDRQDLYPTTIEYTLSQARLLNKDGRLLIATPTSTDLVQHATDGSYLDLIGNDAASTIRHWHDSDENSRAPIIYARIIRGLSGNQTIIQYWFQYFYSGYGYTKGCSLPGIACVTGNNHEGDWEMIQIMLTNGEPQYAAFAQHDESTKRLWQHIEKGGPYDENPVVYVAYGSHASYFKNSYYRAKLQSLTNIYAEQTGRHPAPAMGVHLLTSDTEPKWLAFKGTWGWDNEYNLFISKGGSAAGPRWKNDGASRHQWADPLGWAAAAKWDDDYHYGSNFGLFSDAYKVTISGFTSRHIKLQLKSDSGNVLLDRDVNNIDPTHRRAEFLLNCQADARQTILLHKQMRPNNSEVVFTTFLPEVTCPSGARTESGEVEPLQLTIDLNIPQPELGQVTTAQFTNVEISAGGQASIDLDSAELVLAIDQDGDGVTDETVAPTTTATEAADLAPPAAITDLAYNGGQLRWTAPADEGPLGRPAAYQVRYAPFAVTPATWDYAEPYIHSLTPAAPGEKEMLPITGLPPGDYFFAVRSVDEAYNASPLSNGVGVEVVGSEGFSTFVTIIVR